MKILIFIFGLMTFCVYTSQKAAFSAIECKKENYNKAIDDFNDCRQLLVKCSENSKKNVKIITKIIKKDKIIIKEIKKFDNKKKWTDRFCGFLAGCGTIIIIILCL